VSLERKILNVLTQSVVRPVCPSGEIVKSIVPDSNSRVREDIDVKGKDLTPATNIASLTPGLGIRNRAELIKFALQRGIVK
jgi:hypothetical protein